MYLKTRVCLPVPDYASSHLVRDTDTVYNCVTPTPLPCPFWFSLPFLNTALATWALPASSIIARARSTAENAKKHVIIKRNRSNKHIYVNRRRINPCAWHDRKEGENLAGLALVITFHLDLTVDGARERRISRNLFSASVARKFAEAILKFQN